MPPYFADSTLAAIVADGLRFLSDGDDLNQIGRRFFQMAFNQGVLLSSREIFLTRVAQFLQAGQRPSTFQTLLGYDRLLNPVAPQLAGITAANYLNEVIGIFDKNTLTLMLADLSVERSSALMVIVNRAMEKHGNL